MPRNRGTDVDTEARRLRARDGSWYPLERLALGEGRLYCKFALPAQPRVSHLEHWILPGPGWVITRFTYHPHVLGRFDWYMEPDIISVDGAVWRELDAYLDLFVHEGVRYELDDADEFADAVAAGEIPLAEAAAALHALDRLCKALHRNGFSGQVLLEEFAPDLPQ